MAQYHKSCCVHRCMGRTSTTAGHMCKLTYQSDGNNHFNNSREAIIVMSSLTCTDPASPLYCRCNYPIRTLINVVSICVLPSCVVLACDCALWPCLCLVRVKRQKQDTKTKVQRDRGNRETETDRDRERESEDLLFDVWELSHLIRDPWKRWFHSVPVKPCWIIKCWCSWGGEVKGRREGGTRKTEQQDGGREDKLWERNDGEVVIRKEKARLREKVDMNCL